MKRERVTEKIKGLSSREDKLHPLRYGADGTLTFSDEVDHSDSSEYDDDDYDDDYDDNVGENYDDEFSSDYQDLNDLLDRHESYRYDDNY